MPIPRLFIDVELLTKDIKAVIISMTNEVKENTFQKNKVKKRTKWEVQNKVF